MNPTAVRAIQAMVAPVVLITTAVILSGGLITMYGAVNDRMRQMTRERLDLLTGIDQSLLSIASLHGPRRERLTQIDTQLPMLLRRHHLLRNAVVVVFGCIGVLVISVLAIGVAVTTDSNAVGLAALVLVLTGTAILLLGLLLAARAVMISQDAVAYEVNRSLSLGESEPPGPE